jgi:hypothetical protein
MYKSVLIFFSVAVIVCLFQSCVGPIYSGLRTYPLSPRMIQPVDNRGDKNALPPDPNFVQSYTKYKKSKTNSNFGALVRIIEFEYDISDSISIAPRITSGFDEGEMTGVFTIILDQYELTYENKNPEVREYVEEVSFESSRSINENQTLHQNPISAVANNRQEKKDKVISRSQLYNSAKFLLEAEDARLIQRSKTLYYIIHLQNCEIAVYPTKEQIKVIKRMLLQHYFD